MQLRKKGPSTEGVFRKTCNNKNMRDVREQLNSGLEVDLEAQPVLLLVGLLKVGLAPARADRESSCGSCADTAAVRYRLKSQGQRKGCGFRGHSSSRSVSFLTSTLLTAPNATQLFIAAHLALCLLISLQ